MTIQKTAILTITALAAALLLSQPAFAEKKAQAIFPNEELAAELGDYDYETFCALSAGDSLGFSFGETVFSVYIIRNSPEITLELTADGMTVPLSENGYLHELVRLEGASELTLTATADTELCDLYFFSEGEPPDFVQQWEAPLERCDLLVLGAHADDELLMFGGTLPFYTGQLDLRVQVAYMTDHSAEQPRPHELLDGLWYCGVENYPVIGPFEDVQCWTLSDAKAIYGEDAAVDYCTELIRRTRPSVVVSHDTGGEYGHGAHKLCAFAIGEAVKNGGDSDFRTESAELYGAWSVQKLYLHLDGEIVMDWEKPLSYFGGLTAREAAAKAYRFHRSQAIYGYSVNYSEKWNCGLFGLVFTAVGEDETADFMANVDLVLPEQVLPDTPTTTAPDEAEPEPTETSEADTSAAETTRSESSSENSPVDPRNVIIIALAALSALLLAGLFAALSSRKSKKNPHSR